MFRITMPRTYTLEREYIVSIVIKEFLQLPYALEFNSEEFSIIHGPGDKCLRLSDIFFKCNQADWLTPKSMPAEKVISCNVPDCLQATTVNREISVVFGAPLCENQYFIFGSNRIDCGLDIFGSAFFFLSRYEEMVVQERDEHDRFPDSAALCVRHGFSDSPIVDEYVSILESMLETLWPTLPRPEPQPSVFLTHDVDRPFLFHGEKLGFLVRRIVGDAVTRRSIRIVPRTIHHWRSVRDEGYAADPFYTFDWIMDVSEKHGLRSAFNFIVDHTSDGMDGSYSLAAPEIRSLIRRIGERGHEIGLHPSYNTYRDPKQTASEFEKLKRVCAEEKVQQSAWGGRQHYLRWAGPGTFQNWEDAGLDYDSTLGFARRAGFRCGTSRQYSVFNLLNRTALRLKERAMIVMDGAILGENASIATATEKLKEINVLSARCRQFGGTMTILVHNNSLYLASWKHIYEAALC